jgi:hypothetical protein
MQCNFLFFLFFFEKLCNATEILSRDISGMLSWAFFRHWALENKKLSLSSKNVWNGLKSSRMDYWTTSLPSGDQSSDRRWWPYETRTKEKAKPNFSKAHDTSAQLDQAHGQWWPTLGLTRPKSMFSKFCSQLCIDRQTDALHGKEAFFTSIIGPKQIQALNRHLLRQQLFYIRRNKTKTLCVDSDACSLTFSWRFIFDDAFCFSSQRPSSTEIC